MDQMIMWWSVAKEYLRNQKGQGMVEYALLVTFIALVALVGVKATGTEVNTVFNNIVTKLK